MHIKNVEFMDNYEIYFINALLRIIVIIAILILPFN